jgi:hypothetical protein
MTPMLGVPRTKRERRFCANRRSLFVRAAGFGPSSSSVIPPPPGGSSPIRSPQGGKYRSQTGEGFPIFLKSLSLELSKKVQLENTLMQKPIAMLLEKAPFPGILLGASPPD